MFGENDNRRTEMSGQTAEELADAFRLSEVRSLSELHTVHTLHTVVTRCRYLVQ